MLDRAIVVAWLEAYVQAWKTYDRNAIGVLFSDDAVYYYSPYHEAISGREAIVASWLKEPDALGSYDAHYEPIAIDGDCAITNGISRYFKQDGHTIKDEWDNIFVLRFDEQGRCKEYREWYMQRPKEA